MIEVPTPVAGPHRPLPATPVLAAGGARRTTSIDLVRPEGLAGPIDAHIRGRDLVRGDDGVARPADLVELRVRIDAVSGLILEVDDGSTTSGPAPARADRGALGLVGADVRRGFIRAVVDALPDDAERRTVRYSALEDLNGANLVSGYAPLRAGLYVGSPADGEARAAMQVDVCAGWARDGAMVEHLRLTGNNAVPMGPKAPRLDEPKAPQLDEPKAPRLDEPKAPRLDEPKAPRLDEPKAPRLDEPKAPQLDEPKAPQLDEPKAPRLDEPKAPQLDEPKAPRLDEPKAATPGSAGAWHELAPLAEHSVRRARRLDVHPPRSAGERGRLVAHFRDSYQAADHEMVLHEYVVSANLVAGASGPGLVLDDIEVDVRVLPWDDCPAAAASAARLDGTPVADLPARVRAELVGPSTCTHLNSTMRSLADADALVAALGHAEPA